MEDIEMERPKATPPVLLIHGGVRRTDPDLRSDPTPFSRGKRAAFIELAVSDLGLLTADQVAHIEEISIGARGKKISKLPEQLWSFPSLKRLTVHSTMLVTQILQSKVPSPVEALSIYADSLDLRDVPSAPNLLELNIRNPKSFLFVPDGTFPALRCARLQTGIAQHAKQRARLWKQISGWNKLRELELNGSIENGDFDLLPSGIVSLCLTRGSYPNLEMMGEMPKLTKLLLLPAPQFKSLSGIEGARALEDFECLDGAKIEDFDRLLSMSQLKRVCIIAPPAQSESVFRALSERGVDVVTSGAEFAKT